MKKNYFFSAALLLGAAALLSPVQADAAGWRNMNHLIPNPSGSTGWSGVETGGAMNVGEIFAGAGMVYQVVRDLPAGEYTLTANAFYRDGCPWESVKRHFNGTETQDGVIFINSTEAKVPSLFDLEGKTLADFFNGDEYVWGVVPNSLGEAADMFAAGKYTATVKATHAGGDMVIGYKCYGKPNTLVAGKPVIAGDETEAWSAFTNFKLAGPNGDVKLAGDGVFDHVGADNNWWIENVSAGKKGHGLQNGGVYSKTNASVYDHSVTVKDLPAGKYRFSLQSFNQHYLGAHPGYFVPMKGDFKVWEGKSAYDLYKENATEYPRGSANQDALPSGTVKVDKLHAYFYVHEGEKIAMADYWDGETETNDWLNGYDDEVEGHVKGAKELCKFVIENKIKNLFEENHDEYLEVQNYKMADGNWKYQNWDGTPAWFESGHMREVAAAFVADPTLYKNTIEFELTEPTTVTIGYHKDVNQNNYAHPTFDFKLEYYDPAYTGEGATGGAAIETVEFDENAPVEYFNLQGVRVANPENGLYIVKQGNKVAKRIIK